ncbi:MAG: hypothetical protein WCL19_08590 [Verrucomicrobiota bacterium]
MTESLEKNQPLPHGTNKESGGASVSGTMDWPMACAALHAGHWSTKDFRKSKAVRQVVETLGPVDGRYFAKLIQKWEPALLHDPKVREIDAWGDPIRWPGILLGTPQSFSPTTLRYLAHALWLRNEGFVQPGGMIFEIGVGYGGLAAMNAWVSRATTVLIDLDSVAQLATRQMRDLDLDKLSAIHSAADKLTDFCIISNYAFTELSCEAQEFYMSTIIQHAKRGVILSNASIFSDHIQGRSNEQMHDWFQTIGIEATIATEHQVLCPSDRVCQNSLIHWKR